jgi:hypothetical protein
MKEPQTKEEWWRIFDAMRQNGSIEALVGLIYKDSPKGGDTLLHLDAASKIRDHASIYQILEAIWADAPDKRHIHGWPNWNSLCDLCSEYPVCFEGFELPEIEGAEEPKETEEGFTMDDLARMEAVQMICSTTIIDAVANFFRGTASVEITEEPGASPAKKIRTIRFIPSPELPDTDTKVN